MTSPFIFHAKVADAAMTKVSRLFNASLDDILNELLQNARRAGATRVTIDQIDDPSFGPSICVADDGPGLANYLSLFMLGESAWDDQVCKSEDAAGMGFFSLANRGARIIAQRLGTEKSWILDVCSAAFSGEVPVNGSNGPVGHRGVSVVFPANTNENIVATVKNAARYCPLAVTINGEVTESLNFLENADMIEEWQGVLIGVYSNRPSGFHSGDNINFYGVRLHANLPELHQQYHRSYYARVDVTHCAALKLVLPARKEIVRDEFFDALCSAVNMIFFRLIAKAEKHSLSHANYCTGLSIGIELKEADMLLRPFTPSYADTDRNQGVVPEPVTQEAILYDSAEGPIEEQNVAMVLSQQSGDLRLYEPDPAFKGYQWYDRLSCLTLTGYSITIGDLKQDIEPTDCFTLKGRPDRIQLLLACGDEQTIRNWQLDTDLLIIGEDYSGIDEVNIQVTANSMITPADLVDFLEAALFSPADDIEAGSYDQQQQWFNDEAEDRAVTLLQSSEDADVNAIIRTIQRELAWRLPKDRSVTIRIDGPDIRITGLTAKATPPAA